MKTCLPSLLAGLLAGQRFDSELVGDASLSRRPMRRVIEPLARMGASIEATAEGFPPLRIRGGQALRGIDYALPVASAQVKSAILLAGLYAAGETHVREPHPTRDYTERMLEFFDHHLKGAPAPDWMTKGVPRLKMEEHLKERAKPKAAPKKTTTTDGAR